MKYTTIIISLLIGFNLHSQNSIEHVEPPFWWTGMVNTNLQLMIHGNDISTHDVSINYDGVKLKMASKIDNPNYLILDLTISSETKAGKFDIQFSKNGENTFTHEYQLMSRTTNSAFRESFDQSDVLYLITPDRFANGDPSNDNLEGLSEKLDRKKPGGRHGGDIKGISDHLDYIKNLGFTSIWMNPVLENNMEEYSYHGYSTTDFYKVDPRFGSNEEYKTLVDKAHSMDIKVIMDMIVNHCGSEHWWMDDLPTSDWFNYQEDYLVEGNYTNTSHRKTSIQDPYGSKKDLDELTKGWFVPTMPDLNQENPIMAKYLIQNSIWWIEYSGIDGIRMDTYPYPGKEFMKEWTCAVQSEYPYFNTVGEEWYNDPAIVAHWQQGKDNTNGYTSCLPSLMDFPLQAKLTEALNDEQNNWSGWISAYTTLGLDFLYADPSNLVTFPDNHDMSRFFTQVNENQALFNLGIAFYATMRGIPQFYYGTEILMTNPGTTDHGIIRSDFPGGWKKDKINSFSGKNLTEQQIQTQEYFKKLLNWRKDADAIHQGKLMHFNPKDGIYVYFRYTLEDKVMVILSKNKNEVQLELDRFSEMLKDAKSGTDIITGNKVEMNTSISVPAMTSIIIELD